MRPEIDQGHPAVSSGQALGEQAQRRTLAIFLALVLLGLVIHLAWLDRKSLWLDEVFTLDHSLASIPQIAEGGDPHPPLYYFAMHYWLALGQNEFILRLPSAILGALSIGLMYILGRRWAGEWVGIAAAILFAIAPIHVWFSQEARMYAATCAFGLVAVWALSEAMTNRRWSAWIIWILATVVGLYLSYSTLALLVGELVLLLPASRFVNVSARRVLPVVPAMVAIVLLYAPWLQKPSVQIDQVLGGIAWYFDPVARASARIGFALSSRQLLSLFLVLGFVGAVLLGALSWLVVGWWKRKARSINAGWVVVMIALYVVVLVASVWQVGYGIRRQVLILFPFFLLAVAGCVAQVRARNRLSVGLVAVTIPFLVANLVFIQQQDWRTLARFITDQAHSRDIVLFSASYYDEPFNYYYQGSGDRVGVTASDVPGGLEKLTQGRERVWLILCGDGYTDPRAEIPSWLSTQRQLTERLEFTGIQVQLYGTPKTGVAR